MSDDGWSNRCDRSRTDRCDQQFTLVPFAGISLIRFRGSRINGLSQLRHSDKKLAPTNGALNVNYALTAQNSSRMFDAGGVKHQQNQLIFQHKARFQRLADVR